MKILVIQLARLGDILTTWPSLKALRRSYPDARIDVLVRPRFSEACFGMESLAQIKMFPTEFFFESVYDLSKKDEESIDESLEKVLEFTGSLKEEAYDKIINLSFSPVSSYLVDAIRCSNTEVRGYSRSADGFLSIEDDASAYFYAQVGVGKFNRFHVADLFAEVCGVVLEEEDWQNSQDSEMPPLVERMLNQGDYLLVHVGASNPKKSLSKEKWVLVLNRIMRKTNKKIFLIGAKNEQEIADYICLHVKSDNLTSLVGRTTVSDLFSLIRRAKFLMGCDSGPIHIAGLVGTPVFNLSNQHVRFWETGPKAVGSRVLITQDFVSLGSDRISSEILSMYNEDLAGDDVAQVLDESRSYQYFEEPGQDFEWKLIRALYLGEDFPVPRDLNFVDAIKQLQELNAFSLQQFHAILKKESHEENRKLLDTVDELVDRLILMVPSIQPLVSWYRTEKLRVGPGSKEEIVAAYSVIHEKLANILSIYLGEDLSPIEEIEERGETYVSK